MSEPVLRRDKIIKALKMFHGDPPYNTPGNMCYADGYFAKGLEHRFGKTIAELEAEVGYRCDKNKWRHS